MSNPVMMRVNVSGFGGGAVSVFAVYDPSTGMLLISREEAYEQGERAGFLHITNQAHDVHYDALFTDDETRDAVEAYLALADLNLLSISPKVARCDPSHKIERDGMDSGGMKYRLQSDIKNGQAAVLFACFYAEKQRGINNVNDFLDDMGDLLTIG